MKALRDQVFTRANGICEWSLCTDPPVHLAHIRGKGMGGNPDGTRNTPGNTVALCLFHHDLLDGRSPNRKKLFEFESLLAEIVELRGRQ